MIRKAKAVWRGTGRAGTGHLSTDSGVLVETPYSFKTRFENEKGTNPMSSARLAWSHFELLGPMRVGRRHAHQIRLISGIGPSRTGRARLHYARSEGKRTLRR